MNGYYEYHRDNMKLPDVWIRRDNTCMPHFHSCIEITYVTEGTVQVLLNGASFALHAGETAIFPSYSVHSCVSEQPSQSLILTAPLDVFPGLSKILEGKTFERPLLPPSAATAEIARCMERLLDYRASEQMDAPAAKGYCLVILGLAIEESGLKSAVENAGEDLAKSILQYLQENFLSSVTLEDLAFQFGYSRYRFSHLFNTYFHCSITEYVNSLRVRYAAGMLLETGQTMTQVAMASGFESVRTFNRAFRTHYGQSPTVFRERRGHADPEIFYPKR